MTTADEFWTRAMRDAYRPLTASEQVALLPLRAGYQAEEPISVNWGYRSEPFTVALALRWAERRAEGELA